MTYYILMIRTFAQASPGNGASNAEDFQPTTRNPQNNASSIQQQDNLQGVTNPQEFLNENKEAQLRVNAQPATGQPQAQPRDITSLVLIAVIAIVVGIILFKVSNRLPDKKTGKKLPAAQEPKAEVAKSGETKKPAAKRKAKKSKRRNK